MWRRCVVCSQADLPARVVACAACSSAAALPAVVRSRQCASRVLQACEHVQASNGMQRTRELATGHAQAALDALTVLHPSAERDALAAIAFRVVNRKF